MTSEVVVTLGPLREVGIVLSADMGTTLEIGTPAQAADIVLAELFRGLQGPQGEQGIQGEAGQSGAPGGSTYEHDQMSAAALWTVNHNLGRYPSVTVVDSGNSTVDGSVAYVDSNHLTIAFSVPFAGKAYLN